MLTEDYTSLEILRGDYSWMEDALSMSIANHDFLVKYTD
ncbi:protein of unknown function [Latilactobacillus sakei]|nr:hypothetical protein LSAJ112_120036 [Latilactobacillus sakei]SON68396.1 protein of unknown function [Latilactobacillus sakei]SON72918.1 protein of unknown function [Latilactobacillus sakei]